MEFLRSTLDMFWCACGNFNCLVLHPNKVFIKTIASGVDFLGWVHFPTHRTLRTATKRRMLKKCLHPKVTPETRASYLGLLKHGNAYTLQKLIAGGVVSSS